MNFKFVEVRKSDIKKGDIYIGVSYGPYEDTGFRDVSYSNMEVIEIKEKSILVKNNEDKLEIYGRKVGGNLYYRIRKRES
jgi:hypothetical protein